MVGDRHSEGATGNSGQATRQLSSNGQRWELQALDELVLDVEQAL